DPPRARNQRLVAALPLGDEPPPLTDPQISQPKPQHLAAAQPTQYHRRDHRTVPVLAQRGRQRVYLRRPEDLRQRPRCPHQRHTLAWPLPLPPGRQPPGHRIHAYITASVQEPIQPRHTRQPPTQRPGRYPASTTPGHLQPATPPPPPGRAPPPPIVAAVKTPSPWPGRTRRGGFATTVKKTFRS